MTDADDDNDEEVKPLTDGIDGTLEWPTALMDARGATVDSGFIDPAPEDPAERPSFVEFPLSEFHQGKALWAANYFVLWPLGLALAVSVDVVPVEAEKFCGVEDAHDPHKVFDADCMGTMLGEYKSLDVRQWEYPEGELGETIAQEDKADHEDFTTFLAFVRGRILAMKPDERVTALARLDRFVNAAQLLVAS